jgi:phosphatidylglycerophosphatase A
MDREMTPPVKPNLRNPIHLLAFGLGSGCAPKAPGTFGTLAAIPFWWLFLQDVPLIPYLCVLIAGFAFGVYLCEQTSKDLGVHDHGGIVWDEWIGLWITYIALPSGIEWIIIGFALFRFFDILKPWPIKWLDEKVHGGFGIMIDDVLAGIFALGCVQGLVYLF